MVEHILRNIFGVLALQVIRKYKPMVIMIVGSAGRAAAKEAIVAVLGKRFRTGKTHRFFKTGVDVFFTIIDFKPLHQASGALLILRSFFHALRQICFRNNSYPEVLILELSSDLRPGDIRHFARYLNPKIVVVSSIADISAAAKDYAESEKRAVEKTWAVRQVARDGFVILNRDDVAAWKMRELSKVKTTGFGFSEDAEMRILDWQIDFPNGINFKLSNGGNILPVRLEGCVGKSHAYAAAVGAVIGLIKGLNLVEIADALLLYQAPQGRARILKGIKQTWVIDDTYSVSPVAMRAALEVLGSLTPVKRRVAVLGAENEINQSLPETREAIGRLAAKSADIIITVGEAAKDIAVGASAEGFSSKSLFHFVSPREAGKNLQQMIVPGDVILIKGSRLMNMPHVVEEIMAEPGRAAELLVH